MSNIICVVSERFGKLFWVKKEDFDIKKGDHVIIESELGGELAVVKNISGKVCESSESNKDIVNIVRQMFKGNGCIFNETDRLGIPFGAHHYPKAILSH